MAETALFTLGKFELRVVGKAVVPSLPTQKARALTAFLVANRARNVSRERLLELFWGDFEPERAREGLRTALSSIRRALRRVVDDASAVIQADKSVVRWAAPAEFDAERFAELAHSPNRQDRARALQLYGGDFLEGNYEDWAVTERERLAGIFEETLARAVGEDGNVEAARLLVARNPYHEAAYALLIKTASEANHFAAAGEMLARYRAAAAEIGSQPSDAFEERFADVQAPETTGQADILLPFVARTAELHLLEQGFNAPAGSQSFLALVAGEPGIGKTAVLTRANSLARNAGLRCFTINCSDDPRRLGPWRTLYERLTGRNFDELTGGFGDVAHLAARQMLASLDRPSAFFVDDAHLLIGDSLASLQQLIRLAAGGAHAFVVSVRPEARERFESMLASRSHESIALGPLQRADVATALALLADTGVARFADVLYERSGGNPLFLTALLQSLVQKQALRRERGRWHVVRTLDEPLELPQDLRASIEARLREAGDDAAVVACALALEPSATAEDLASALEYPEGRVLDALDRLIEFGLLHDDARSGSFYFVHDVVRDVSSGMLNAGRRVALHRAFSRRFERSPLPEAVPRLARHLRAAGLAMPAASAYLDCARAALSRYAVRDAMVFCEDGIAVLERIEHTPESDALRSRLELTRALGAGHAGNMALAFEAADEAVRCARVSSRPIEIVNGLIVRAALHGALADARVQLSDALEAAALAGGIGERRLGARAAVEAAAATRNAGAIGEATQLAREACATAAACDDPAGLFAGYEELLLALICSWHFEQVSSALSESARTAESLGSAAQARLACLRAAYDYLGDRLEGAIGDMGDALRHIELLRVRNDLAGRDLSYHSPLPLVGFTAHYLGGFFACRQSRWGDAFSFIQACRDFTAIVALPRYGAALAMLETDALLGRNAPDDAYRADGLWRAPGDTLQPQDIVGWSDCPALARARIAARLRTAQSRPLLRGALDVLEENARRTPLDCDRAFFVLAGAAIEADEPGIRDRALQRSARYRAMRISKLNLVQV